jgi:pimeloyl-ACP methyl ester carboxylesterase
MKTANKKIWIRLAVLGITLVVAIQVGRHFFREEEHRIRTDIREIVIKEFPEVVEQLNAVYGLRPFKAKEFPEAGDDHSTAVILIHGLDEPGKVWINLAPALAGKGFLVWIMTYPNDQPITESAQFFLNQLELHNLSGTGSIAIVAHSMGGLVAREMLTAPMLSYATRAANGELPVIEQLIMVGTPNHGSGLAQFRIFTEVRDQWTNLFKGNYHWLHGIIDGAGEAGIDLIPDSKFLQELNSRPLPGQVNMLVIAGEMSQKQRNDIEDFARDLGGKFSEDTRDTVKQMKNMFLEATQQVGDGLVSVNSARLPGVPLKIVQGTHLSMIRNIRPDSKRVPPAIPIIIEQLKPATADN